MLACQRLQRLTELQRQDRNVEVPRKLDRPVRFTPGRCRITLPRKPQLACNLRQGATRCLQRRIIEFRPPRRTTWSACHASSLSEHSVSIRTTPLCYARRLESCRCFDDLGCGMEPARYRDGLRATTSCFRPCRDSECARSPSLTGDVALPSARQTGPSASRARRDESLSSPPIPPPPLGLGCSGNSESTVRTG